MFAKKPETYILNKILTTKKLKNAYSNIQQHGFVNLHTSGIST